MLCRNLVLPEIGDLAMMGRFVKSMEARHGQSPTSANVTFAAESCPHDVDASGARSARLRLQEQSQGLYRTATGYLGGPQAGFPTRLPRPDIVAGRLERPANGFATRQGASLHDPPKGGPTA